MLLELVISSGVTSFVFFNGLDEVALSSVSLNTRARNSYELIISEMVSESNKKHINSREIKDREKDREIEEFTKKQPTDQLIIDELIDQVIDKLMNDIPSDIPNDTESFHQKKHNKNDKIIQELINIINSYIKTDIL